MLHTRVDRGVAPIVYLEGEVDLDCTETLRWVVSDAVRGCDQAVLDFGGVRFIDSSGAGVFVRLCLDLRAQGIQLRARSLSPAVEDVFAMLKVRELVGDAAFIEPQAKAG